MSTLTWQKDADFVAVYPHVLKVEGGYADLKGDSGGPTMYGIAYNYNQAAVAKFGITRQTMRSLTKQQALQIYYEKYWMAAACNFIPDTRLALVHFDCAVNQGVGASLKFLQGLSKNPNHFEGNGKNEALFYGLACEYVAARLRAYTSYKNQATFLCGWVNRMAIILSELPKLKG